jgi:N-acetylmuramoyl-L-alanine amidase
VSALRLAPVLLALAVALPAPRAAAAPEPAVAKVRKVEGTPCVGANDFARLLGGTLFWRSDVRKLVVRTRAHHLTFTVDAPIVIVDDRTVRIDAPVRSHRGELQIPVSLLSQLPRDSTLARLVLEPGGKRIRATLPGGLAIAPGAAAGERETRGGAVPGLRSLRVVVLDPGHGGEDAGVTEEGASEKDLALQLARLLAGELGRRSNARVVLTRDGDRALAQTERAQIANRARADLVLSLHFDGEPGTRAHGATAWCPPPALAGTAGVLGEPGILPWRDAALGHAAESRALADAVTGALRARGLGPARVREWMPVSLLGVNAPGLTLECATLTSPEDRERVMRPEGLHDLAAAIAEGVIAFARHE